MPLALFGFLNISTADLLDILIVAVIIFMLLKWVKGSSTVSIFIVIVSLYLIRSIAVMVNMRMLSSLMSTILGLGVMALIVIFQPEIRRFLIRMGDSYREAFMCEIRAVKKVRDEMGMKNVNVMLPFVRTIDEVRKITAMMESVGLYRGADFKLHFMAEIPINIFMAEEFSKCCDWFSIGSNDLTQLTMGCDRDSDILGKMGYFDERNPGVKAAIAHLIKTAHANGVKVSICGQAPSVYPEFCEFLIEQGIDCISLNPDTLIRTKKIIASAEQKVLLKAARARLG